MPKPIAICIEDLDAAASTRFLCCVAIAGRLDGLGLDSQAQVVWAPASEGQAPQIAVELWVSGDEKLMLYRREAAPQLWLRRGQRSLDVPAEKPVVLLDKDVVELGAKRLCIHVHGKAPAVSAPYFYKAEPVKRSSRLGQAAMAAAALGLGATALGCQPSSNSPAPVKDEEVKAQAPIEVRPEPPSVAPADLFAPPPPPIEPDLSSPPIEVRPEPPSVPNPNAGSEPDVLPAKPEVSEPPPIEVRPEPPKVAAPSESDDEPITPPPAEPPVDDEDVQEEVQPTPPIEIRDHPPAPLPPPERE
ncbi:MAG: hypothetical protein RBU37_02135 [Myxococcota bacterium]|jgi:hypothetical protein|nr:hypothetical protein [Myxococcota bacterium]